MYSTVYKNVKISKFDWNQTITYSNIKVKRRNLKNSMKFPQIFKKVKNYIVKNNFDKC